MEMCTSRRRGRITEERLAALVGLSREECVTFSQACVVYHVVSHISSSVMCPTYVYTMFLIWETMSSSWQRENYIGRLLHLQEKQIQWNNWRRIFQHACQGEVTDVALRAKHSNHNSCSILSLCSFSSEHIGHKLHKHCFPMFSADAGRLGRSNLQVKAWTETTCSHSVWFETNHQIGGSCSPGCDQTNKELADNRGISLIFTFVNPSCQRSEILYCTLSFFSVTANISFHWKKPSSTCSFWPFTLHHSLTQNDHWCLRASCL